VALMHIGFCVAIHCAVTVRTNTNLPEHELRQVKRYREKLCSAHRDADATVKPFATRPVLLSYTNAAQTAIRTPSMIPNKICMAGVSHRSAS
jgi:hypothetical protein